MSQKSDDDTEIFRQAMQAVRKLTPADKIPLKQQSKKESQAYCKQQAQYVAPSKTTGISLKNTVSSEEILSFAQAGLRSAQYQDLQKGRVIINASIDLHGHNLEEALIALDNFFNSAREKKFRCLHIIHGKGGQAIIKNAVFAFLQAQKDILAFHSAPPKLGGAGSVLVLLKR